MNFVDYECLFYSCPLTGTPATAGPGDIELEVTYYDFSKVHEDFNDLEYVTISDPSYVDSPYGAWLAASSTPISDSFSKWYRNDADNVEIVSTLILEEITGTTKRLKNIYIIMQS